MYKKTITYTDYDGNPRTEDFYFNMTQAEIIEWMTTDADYTFDRVLENMTKKLNVKGLMKAVRDLIYTAYGEKSLDGRRFIKTPEVKANFMETPAYSALFMELVTDGTKTSDFVNAIIPKDLASSVDKIMKDHPNATPEELRALASGQLPDSTATAGNVIPVNTPSV